MNLLTNEKKWIANKLKESTIETPKKSNVFPSLKDTFLKIEDLSLRLNLHLNHSIRSISDDTQQLKLKKNKSTLDKTQKPETLKKTVSTAKWSDCDSTFEAILADKSVPLVEPVKTQSPDDKITSNPQTNSENMNKTDGLNSTMENSGVSENFKSTEKIRNPKGGSELDMSDSKSIERYIEQNKANLTNLDLFILNSIAKKCFKGNREQSRFEFANKKNSAKIFLEKCPSMNNLMNNFFKEETELFKLEMNKAKPKEERCFKLFNQSYTFERIE